MHAVRRWQWILSIVLAVAAVVACDDAEKYEIVTDCTEDARLYTACSGGSSFTCSGSALPSDSNPHLLCESGHPQQNGETVFCCSVPSSSTCSVGTPSDPTDPTAVCFPDETEYTCKGGNPSAGNPSLSCDNGRVSNDATIFCCTPVTGPSATTCTTDQDAGCTNGGTGYDCPASVTPSSADPSLSCGSAQLLSNGNTSYCCTSDRDN